jgi:gluconate 2-dehydrogenase gamma chain
MSTMDRRRALKLIGAAGVAPLAGGFDWTSEEVARSASQLVARQAAPATVFAPDFFNPHEWETVRALVDLVIPADERSPAATAAGVPEFIDFMMVDGTEARRTAMRGGLAWLDTETRRRHDVTFLTASDAQRRDVLDAIAWPQRASPTLQSGVAWFNSFRDLTGAGFFSSRIGHEDLQYMGNVMVPVWNGCPEPALRKLGVTYDVMNTRR